MDSERFKCGTFEGTGSALNVICGFKPRYVYVHNFDSANLEKLEWWEGMPAAYGLKSKDSTLSRLTSAGITQYDDVLGQGFTVGADADVNASAETCFYVAVR